MANQEGRPRLTEEHAHALLSSLKREKQVFRRVEVSLWWALAALAAVAAGVVIAAYLKGGMAAVGELFTGK